MNKDMHKTTPYMVSLYIYGDQLDPVNVTNMLMTTPTRGWKKGGKKRPDKEYLAKTGLWQLKTKSSSEFLDDHLDELIENMRNRKVNKIHDISGVEKAKIDIFVLDLCASSSEEICFAISSTNIEAIAEMELGIDFTVGRLSSSD